MLVQRIQEAACQARHEGDLPLYDYLVQLLREVQSDATSATRKVRERLHDVEARLLQPADSEQVRLLRVQTAALEALLQWRATEPMLRLAIADTLAGLDETGPQVFDAVMAALHRRFGDSFDPALARELVARTVRELPLSFARRLPPSSGQACSF